MARQKKRRTYRFVSSSPSAAAAILLAVPIGNSATKLMRTNFSGHTLTQSFSVYFCRCLLSLLGLSPWPCCCLSIPSCLSISLPRSARHPKAQSQRLDNVNERTMNHEPRETHIHAPTIYLLWSADASDLVRLESQMLPLYLLTLPRMNIFLSFYSFNPKTIQFPSAVVHMVTQKT